MKIVIPCPPVPESGFAVIIGVSTGVAAHHWWPSLLVGVGAGLIITTIAVIRDRRRQHHPD